MLIEVPTGSQTCRGQASSQPSGQRCHARAAAEGPLAVIEDDAAARGSNPEVSPGVSATATDEVSTQNKAGASFDAASTS